MRIAASFCRRHPAWAVMIAAAVMLVIPAALTPFNTKGEPREAIVALSMLMSGDWVLPVSFGADIPYKPPFLAWMIAMLSLPFGSVSELTARLPSILACMAIGATVASFVRRDMGWSGGRAFAAALLTITTVEVWRGAGACRVDMVLTAAITGACVTLYRLALYGGVGRFAGAVALMTVAVLTKGPVGMVLPCLIIAVWAIGARLGSRHFWTLAAIVAAAALLSLVIPAWWYAEAYRRGGREFLDLAMEENFGRMTGTMSYASHNNPWWYNLQTLVAGLLPYTLIPVLALFEVRRPSGSRIFRNMGRASLLAVAACVVTLVFYTIPSSKRSVYLLPIYPFIAPGLLWLWEWLAIRSPKVERLFGSLITIVAVVVAVALLAAPFQPWLSEVSLIASLLSAVAVGTVVIIARHSGPVKSTLAMIATIYTAIGIAILPPVMTAKTDRGMACTVAATAGPADPVWELITDDPLLRYYTIGFYLSDRIRQLPDEIPAGGGWLLTSPDDAAAYLAAHPGISLTPVAEKRKSCDTRRPMALYRLDNTNSIHSSDR